jgi:hypothetical protein
VGMFDFIQDTPYASVWNERLQQREVEERHGLDLTTGARSGARWTAEHLGAADWELGQLPTAHVAPLHALELGGAHSGEWGHYLHERREVALAGSGDMLEPTGKHGAVTTSLLGGHDHPASQLHMTLGHEVGHGVHADHPEAAERILQQAGWSSGLSLYEAGLSVEEGNSLWRDGGERELHNGRRCQKDQPALNEEKRRLQKRGLGPGEALATFSCYDPEFVPTDTGDDSKVDRWAYGRTHPNEYFAEMYTKGANLPEQLYEDLVGEPGAMAELFQDDPELHARYLEAARRKQAQWDIMRGDVFGVTEELVDARAAGLPREAAESFRSDAQRVMTPAQLDRLRQTYAAPEREHQGGLGALGRAAGALMGGLTGAAGSLLPRP